jgi:hypothetical protein
MNAHAVISEQREAVQPFDPAQLAAANINPATGLATDYLNHFNEAIMLLELLPSMPACIEDLMEWRVMSYRQHFLSTQQKNRDLVLAAYEQADPWAKRALDELTESMDVILTIACDALNLDLSSRVVAALAQEAGSQLKPLVARAGAVINGHTVSSEGTLPGAPQATVDALMERR